MEKQKDAWRFDSYEGAEKFLKTNFDVVLAKDGSYLHNSSIITTIFIIEDAGEPYCTDTKNWGHGWATDKTVKFQLEQIYTEFLLLKEDYDALNPELVKLPRLEENHSRLPEMSTKPKNISLSLSTLRLLKLHFPSLLGSLRSPPTLFGCYICIDDNVLEGKAICDKPAVVKWVEEACVGPIRDRMKKEFKTFIDLFNQRAKACVKDTIIVVDETEMHYLTNIVEFCAFPKISLYEYDQLTDLDITFLYHNSSLHPKVTLTIRDFKAIKSDKESIALAICYIDNIIFQLVSDCADRNFKPRKLHLRLIIEYGIDEKDG